MQEDVIRVFVGADRSQALAIDVLAYSIRKHTDAQVEVIPMVDLDVPTPKDPRNWQRTGFSFSRFCIPELAGYRGRAIYMDADMQVFKDIRELWNIPFDGRKVLVQESVEHTDVTLAKSNAPVTRKKQCAVMLLDCGQLRWDVRQVVRGLDEGQYTYAELLENMCILPEDDVGYAVPFRWNSLEHFDASTCLIHYTDMGTQPWVSTQNPNGELWFDAVRSMLADGSLRWQDLVSEVRAGYFRPSLLREIRWGRLVPAWARKAFNSFNEFSDKFADYAPHRAVYEKKRHRMQAVRDFQSQSDCQVQGEAA